MEFSVLMSVYHKEHPEYLKASLESMLSQTLLPAEIVMVEDGPLTPELYSVLDDFEKNCPLLKRVPLAENVGLGKALNAGLEACSHELVARMDTDDIAMPERFEKQAAEFEKDPALGLLGSHVTEFEGTPDNVTAKKLVPVTEEEVRRYARRRNPFNHPTVMFRKGDVLAAGGYLHAMWCEDYYLWARMLAKGCKARNIDESLLYFRAGSDVYMRRGGWKYVKSIVSFKWKLYKLGISGLGDFIYSAGVHAAVGLMPNKLRAMVYGKLLRK